MNGLDKATLIQVATTHPVLSVRRSAAHTLYSLGAIHGAISTSNAMATARAQELAANAEALAAIEKAQAVKS